MITRQSDRKREVGVLIGGWNVLLATYTVFHVGIRNMTQNWQLTLLYLQNLDGTQNAVIYLLLLKTAMPIKKQTTRKYSDYKILLWITADKTCWYKLRITTVTKLETDRSVTLLTPVKSMALTLNPIKSNQFLSVWQKKELRIRVTLQTNLFYSHCDINLIQMCSVSSS